MLFQTKNGKVIKGFPLYKYRYRIFVDEVCFAVRMILDNEEEYILYSSKSIEAVKSKRSYFNKKCKVKTNIIKVKRVSETKYEYEAYSDNIIQYKSGTPYGSFEQKNHNEHPDLDEFTIGSRHLYNKSYYEDKEQPDEFTIGASYLAEECRKENPLFDDEFTIGASYASSDFYEYQTNYLKSIKKDK